MGDFVEIKVFKLDDFFISELYTILDFTDNRKLLILTSKKDISSLELNSIFMILEKNISNKKNMEGTISIIGCIEYKKKYDLLTNSKNINIFNIKKILSMSEFQTLNEANDMICILYNIKKRNKKIFKKNNIKITSGLKFIQ